MFKHLLLTSFFFISFCARGMVTNRIETTSLGHLGTGVSDDGWRVSSVSNYAATSHQGVLKLHLKASTMYSPVYTNVIVAIELDVLSSSKAGRRLAITPFHKGAPLSELKYLCDYSTSSDKFLHQSVHWPYESHVDAIQFALDGGSSTAWGIRNLDVICEARRAPTVISIR